MILGILIGILLMMAIGMGVYILQKQWRLRRRARKGRQAERLVATELRRLRRREARVLNDIMVPVRGGGSQIDHLVISRRGIFVIETKSHSGHITGTEHGQYWQQNFETRSQSFYNPLLQNDSHIRALRRILPGVGEEAIMSVIVFTNAWRLDVKADPIIKRSFWGGERQIARTLIPAEERRRRWWRGGEEVRLDPLRNVLKIDDLIEIIRCRPKIFSRREIEKIAGRIMKAAAEEGDGRHAHAARVEGIARSGADSIRSGICPRCGAPLRIVKGESGEFIGCTRYPECRFVCSISRLAPRQ